LRKSTLLLIRRIDRRIIRSQIAVAEEHFPQSEMQRP
jgi:hypothetical protein